MLKNWYVAAVIAVLILAAVPRLYQLGQVPHGMTVDEASIGYNGFSIMVAHRDEWLIKMPLAFRAFGDYKSPIPVYVNGISTALFGLNLPAVRLPFAVSGIVAVAMMMGLTFVLLRETLPKTFSLYLSQQTKWLVLLSGALLATTPWHVHFSRLGYEAGMALTLLIGGVWLLLEVLQMPVEKLDLKSAGSRMKVAKKVGILVLSAFFLALTTYTYQSAKVVMPALVLVILILWHKKARSQWPFILGLLLVAIGFMAPQIYDTLWGPSGERFNQASLFNKGMSPVALFELVSAQFLQHLGPRFLLFGQTTTLRHGDGVWGVLLITSLVLTLMGLAALGNQILMWLSHKAKLTEIKVPLLGAAWLLIGTVPASVGVDSPHSTRALLALPGFILLAVWGAAWTLESIRVSSFNKKQMGTHGEKQSLLKMLIGTWILIHSFLFFSYQKHYFTVFAAESAAEFNDGYLEAIEYVIPYEKGLNGLEPVEQIAFTAEYDHPYIYLLFARKTSPYFYHSGSLIKYVFVDRASIGDFARKNAIIVAGSDDDLPVERADKVIYGSDGSVRFKMYHTEK